MERKKAEAIYRSSIKVLREVQMKSGGCLATPRGERYPYVYPRDNAICILGFVSAGLFREARRSLKFILKTQLSSGAFPQRVENDGIDASYKPIQIDGTALTIYALSGYARASGDLMFAREQWGTVEASMRYITKNIHKDKGLVFTPNSVHEFPPMEEGLEIWANATSFSALEQAYQLGLSINRDRVKWLESANLIKNGIKSYMWDTSIRSFIKTIRLDDSSSIENDADSGCLALCEFGVFPDKDPRIIFTMKRMEKELWNSELGGLCRYPKYQGRNNGGWGPWPHFTLMLARHYIRLGNRKKADSLLGWVIGVSWKNELPEHISTVKEFEEYVSDFEDAGILRKDRLIMIDNTRKHPMFKKGVAYISLPLAWPHAEFIQTWNLYKKVFGK